MKKLWALLVVLLLVIAACSSKESKKENCTSDNDCSTSQTCKEAYCSNGDCKTKTTTNCCGNNNCEKNENKCSCSVDCGTCEGKVTFKDDRGRTKTATFLQNSCKDKECGISFDEKRVKTQNVFDEYRGKGFKLNAYATYPQPFVIGKAKLVLKLQLKDLDETKISTPIIINEIRVQSGDNIFGRVPTILSLDAVGDEQEQEVPITFDPDLPEQEERVTIYADYEYTPLNRDGEEEDTVRETYKFSLKDEIVFVDSSVI